MTEDLRFEHPHADEIAAALRGLGLDAKVARADEGRIIALSQTSNVQVQLS